MKALVRLSPEITTKAAQTRARFVRRLCSNLKTAFKVNGLQAKVRAFHVRVYLEYEDPRVLMVAKRVFGVHSISPAHEEPFTTFEALIEKGVELMKSRIEGKTYAVRARVADKDVGFGAQMVNEHLGAALNPYAKVNLSNPDVTVQVEVREGQVHFFTDRIAGEGGIPLGCGGRAVVLLSAGFDSAVAAYLMMKRGVEVDFVSLRMGGPTHERAVLAVANRLAERWAMGQRCRLWVVPFEETSEAIRRDVEQRYRQLVLKRLMYRTAEIAASMARADAVVTGESLGQVSSQTLKNLRALTMSEEPFVVRPLLTMGKEEIMRLAEHVGTHHLSSGVPEFCALGSKPSTGAHRRVVKEQEALVTYDEVQAVKDTVRLDLPAVPDASDEDLLVETAPEGAVLLDIRTPPSRRAHHIEGAEPVDALEILHQPQLLKTDACYVVVCDQGQRSQWLAQRLRGMGFRAHSLKFAAAEV